MKIQEYLIAAIQNIEVLLRYGEQLKKSLLVKVNQVKRVIKEVIQPISGMIKDFRVMETQWDYVNSCSLFDLVNVQSVDPLNQIVPYSMKAKSSFGHFS